MMARRAAASRPRRESPLSPRPSRRAGRSRGTPGRARLCRWPRPGGNRPPRCFAANCGGAPSRGAPGGRGARRRVEGGARGDGSRAGRGATGLARPRRRRRPRRARGSVWTPTPTARLGTANPEFGDVPVRLMSQTRAARPMSPRGANRPTTPGARAMPAAPGDGVRVDATLPPREWESWVDEAECLWVALSAGKAARAVARRRPPPPRSGRASRVDPDVAFASPEPSSRPWPAVKLFTTGGATDAWRPFSPFVAPFAARVASPRRPPRHDSVLGRRIPESPDASNRLDTEDDATSRVSRCPSAHHAARARRVAFDAWRLATLAARADELRLRASLADHLFTADARRFNSPRASAERLWRSLRASDVRARRHSASPDVAVTTSRGAGVLSDLGARVTHLAFAEARNWMRAHAFAAFAGWRFVTTRDANRRAATVRFRATRSNSIMSRLFSSWRVDARRRATIRRGVSRMTFRRERRALVVAMLTWRTRVALAPTIANAVAAATRRWRRYRLRAPFRAWRDEGLADARAFARRADAFRFATCAGAACGRWRRRANHQARVRAWDAFAVRWRARRVAATTTRARFRVTAAALDARRSANSLAERRRFSNLVLLFHAWRRRAAAIVAGTELVRLAWVKWNRERLETAFGAMHAEVVLARAARVDVADLMNLQKLARIVAAWRGRTADERDAIEPAVQSMARCAAAWRARSAWRAWRRSVAETRDEEIRARRFARRRALALFSRRWRAWRSEHETRRRATIRAAAPLTRRFIFRAWFERWVSGAEARRAARRVATARAEATRDGNAKRRATQRWRHVAARRVFDRMQEARAWTFRVRALTRRWRARGVEDSPPRATRARAEAHRFAVVARAWRRRTAEIRVERVAKTTTIRALRVSKDGDGVERVERDDARDSTRASPSATVRGVHARGTLRDCLREGEYGEAPRGERRREIARTITPLGGGARRRRRRRPRARDAARQTRDEKIGIRIDGGTIGGDMGRRRERGGGGRVVREGSRTTPRRRRGGRSSRKRGEPPRGGEPLAAESHLAVESPFASPASRRWQSSPGGASSAAFFSAQSSPGRGVPEDADRGDEHLDREPRRSSQAQARAQPRGTRRPPPSSTASSPGFVSARSSPASAHTPVYVPPRYAPPNGDENENGNENENVVGAFAGGFVSAASGRPPARARVGASRSLHLDLRREGDVDAARAPRFGSDDSPERPQTGTGTGRPGDEPASSRGDVSGILDRLRRASSRASEDGVAGVRVTWSPVGTPTGPSRESSARMLALRARFE